MGGDEEGSGVQRQQQQQQQHSSSSAAELEWHDEKLREKEQATLRHDDRGEGERFGKGGGGLFV